MVDDCRAPVGGRIVAGPALKSTKTNPTRSRIAGAPRLRAALLAWFASSRRDLPWRRTRDPYAILVSEVMLQQTRVDTAVVYYEKFLNRFPTVSSLAGAPIEDVLAVWAGLGYYRRARMLHAAAAVIVHEHNGRVPRDLELLKQLPGIGEYTAGAIASIAYDVAAPAVDGNVIRVLSRVMAFEGDPLAPAGRRIINDAAAGLAVGEGSPGDWTQALMELGATHCIPRNPLCLLCPIVAHCAATRLGLVSKIPPPKKRPATRKVRHAAAIVRRKAGFLLVKRDETSHNAGLYEFPTVEYPDGDNPVAALTSFVRECSGLRITLGDPLVRVQHTITNHRIEVLAFDAGAPPGAPRGECVFANPREASSLGLTAAARKILKSLEQ